MYFPLILEKAALNDKWSFLLILVLEVELDLSHKPNQAVALFCASWCFHASFSFCKVFPFAYGSCQKPNQRQRVKKIPKEARLK